LEDHHEIEKSLTTNFHERLKLFFRCWNSWCTSL